MLERAFNTFKKEQERPTLIIVDSHIAWGAPNKQDTHAAHGEPLGEEEIKLTKRNYGWPEDDKFLVPDGVREHFAAGIGARGKELRGKWMALFEQYRGKHAELADQLIRMQRRELPDGWDKDLPTFPADAKGVGRPRRLRQGAQRARQERAVADRRLGRPRAVDQDAAHLRGRRRLHARTTTAGATSTSASASTPWAPS